MEFQIVDGSLVSSAGGRAAVKAQEVRFFFVFLLGYACSDWTFQGSSFIYFDNFLAKEEH